MKENKPGEGYRLHLQYKMFDKMISESYGGEYDAMYAFIFSKDCSKQFPEKYLHDCLISDFIKWSRNRGVLSEWDAQLVDIRHKNKDKLQK